MAFRSVSSIKRVHCRGEPSRVEPREQISRPYRGQEVFLYQGKEMNPAMDLQTIILRLQSYWAGKGCLIWQPYDIEKGAGTMNPATFLRALGPEPWAAAYVEPSRRPTDGRYGENPNRLYQHLHTGADQPCRQRPGFRKALRLERSAGRYPLCRRQLGVADAVPGACWEVWLDGMRLPSSPFSAGWRNRRGRSQELTYGLERIAMYIQIGQCL